MPAEDLSALADRILTAVRSVRYGAIELVIHDGRVVQIEKREKIRLSPSDRTAGAEPWPSPREC